MFDITKEWAEYCEGQINILKKENKYDRNRHHYYLDKLFSKNLGDAAYDFLFYEFKSDMSDEVRQELTINIQKFFLKCLEHQKELDTKIIENIKSLFMSEFILDFYKFPEDKKVFKNTVYEETNNFVYDFVVKIRERALLEKIESSDIQRKYKIKIINILNNFKT